MKPTESQLAQLIRTRADELEVRVLEIRAQPNRNDTAAGDLSWIGVVLCQRPDDLVSWCFSVSRDDRVGFFWGRYGTDRTDYADRCEEDARRNARWYGAAHDVLPVGGAS